MEEKSVINHLSEEEFYNIMEHKNKGKSRKNSISEIYSLVINAWPSPYNWFESETKSIHTKKSTTDSYWIAWGMLKGVALPIVFLKTAFFHDSERLLKSALVDFNKLKRVRNQLSKIYKHSYLKRIYVIVLKSCLYLGINDLKNLENELVFEMRRLGLYSIGPSGHILINVLYYMGYSDYPALRNSPLGPNARKKVISNYWSANMKVVINEFLDNMNSTSRMCKKTITYKKGKLNYFAEWYVSVKKVDIINDLSDFKTEDWFSYIEFIGNTQGISNKSKNAVLLSILQFIEWLRVKRNNIICNNLKTNKKDYSKVSKHQKIYNLAFEKREHAERILKYLINQFQPSSIKDIFIKEAIIISANSGMRISEIRMLPYKCCYYSEDECLYKIILDYEDKVSQVNRPCYITKDGYEAVKRVEKIREENGNMQEKYNYRKKKKYVHLFEYRSTDHLSSTNIGEFICRIKEEIGLIEKDSKVVKGNMHAFRHFFAMTVFRESGYNIGVVKYLLGHRKYGMSFQYLEEEITDFNMKVRDTRNKESEKATGRALDNIIDLVINNKDAQEFIAVSRVLERSKQISDLVDSNSIKKVPLGYCLSPCENANKCFKCNKFLTLERNKEELTVMAESLYSLICYKITLFNNNEEALKNMIIQQDISDLCILFEEMKDLGVDTSAFFRKLGGVR